ncbi:serine protease Do [Lentibacillus persicus]|uniref:Serine protease Do n=1 Tax=Lentibacillus persicus TaxID=640948 RepID=A0A1I1UI86_9BACI|nr:trypsin-like peptidase domain-containing protein [Lentibacillus persicus]SFD70437.1 serine protease Do [Lentibacillus persicus]
MGYFDNDEQGHRTKKKHWLRPALIGAFLGIAVVLIALPGVLQSDILPQDRTNETENNTGGNHESGAQPAPDGFVSVNISSQITDVVNEVSPAVVGVINIQRQGDFWQQEEGQQQTEAGTGSGVIYKTTNGSAYVITNHHVIEGADTVEVILSDDTRVEADILGSDLFSDLAVLEMNSEHVQDTITMGTSENVKVGEPAIAIGNPLGMFLGSVTQGVISGTQRTIPQDFNQDGRADWQAEVIQTDAAINPGNSGGALINIDGQLIGVNSMKINQEAVEGIGFAIPIDTARPIIDELETTGKVDRPYMGVEVYSLEEVPKTEWESTLNLPSDVEGGVYVWTVESGTPADTAGLQRLDVITAMDGKQVSNMIELRKILYQEKEIGDSVTVTYYREGEKQEATFELVEQR